MFLKSMFVAATLGMCLSAAPIVQYTTAGVFGSSGTNISTIGSSSLTFIFGSGGPVDVGFGTANVSFGQFDLNSTQANPPQPLNDTFTLTITQSSPTVANANLIATLTGNVSVDFSNAYIQFSNLTAVLGGVTYHISNAGNGIPGRVNLPTPTVNNGVGLASATLQGDVSASAVPEPSTYAAMGAGLLALYSLRRRSVK